jgi:hypothetical protein
MQSFAGSTSIDEEEDEYTRRRGRRRHVFLLRCPIEEEEEEEEVLRPESALLLRAPTAAPAGEEEEVVVVVENIIFSLYLCSNVSFDRYTRGELTSFSYLIFLHFSISLIQRERENNKRRNGAPSLQQRW